MRRVRAFAIGIGIVGGLASCAGSREVSKLRYTTTDCPDPKGCEAPLGEQEYQLPDEARDPVADAAAAKEEPSCKTVAVALAALELGNYASDDTEEERAAITAKQEKACAAAKLDNRELACMSTVTATTHVGYCTRKMGAPTARVKMLSENECTQLMSTLQSYGTGDRSASYLASCIEDGWSNELATCIGTRGVYDPMGQCWTEAPGWVFDQIQSRIDSAAK